MAGPPPPCAPDSAARSPLQSLRHTELESTLSALMKSTLARDGVTVSKTFRHETTRRAGNAPSKPASRAQPADGTTWRCVGTCCRRRGTRATPPSRRDRGGGTAPGGDRPGSEPHAPALPAPRPSLPGGLPRESGARLTVRGRRSGPLPCVSQAPTLAQAKATDGGQRAGEDLGLRPPPTHHLPQPPFLTYKRRIGGF